MSPPTSRSPTPRVRLPCHQLSARAPSALRGPVPPAGRSRPAAPPPAWLSPEPPAGLEREREEGPGAALSSGSREGAGPSGALRRLRLLTGRGSGDRWANRDPRTGGPPPLTSGRAPPRRPRPLRAPPSRVPPSRTSSLPPSADTYSSRLAPGAAKFSAGTAQSRGRARAAPPGPVPARRPGPAPAPRDPPDMLCGRWGSRRRREPPVPAQVAASVALPPPPALQDGGARRPGLRALKKMGQ